MDSLLVGVSCAREVGMMMSAWGAGQEFVTAPPSETGRRMYRFPTGRLGTWVVLTVPPAGGGATVTRVTPRGATSHAFTEGCSYRVDESEHQPPSQVAGDLFTDGDLRSSLAGTPDQSLVIYSWSPHMPLSVDGYAEVAEAAHARGMTALPVLIAHSDLDFARREAERVGMPSHALRQIDSVELIQRGVQLHAPSILVFGLTRVSPLLPGYRNAEGYGRFLDAFLDGGP